MKIEKGKLYYDTNTEQFFKAPNYGGTAREGITDKIAVYCPTKADCRFVNNVLGHNVMYRDDVVIFIDNLKWSNYDVRHIKELKYRIISIDQLKQFYPEQYTESNAITVKTDGNVQNTQPHYDNTHGSLYKIAEQRKWNSYQFDIVKRVDRALKKGQFKEDLQKTKDLIDLWLREESN